MRDAQSIRDMAAAVEAAHGRLDMLICNAGVMTFGPFADHAPDDIDWITEVNLSGLLHTCHASVPAMRRSGGGQIVLMCSMNALFAVPTSLLYATTKWGVRGFGMGLRAELAADQIGVTTVLPGAVATSLIAQARSYDDELVSTIAPFIERFATRPEHLAKKVLRAARRDRAELIVGIDAWSIRLITRLAPGLLNWLLTWSYRRTAKRITTSQ
jgi:short-subunit dehydrogenase